MDCSIEDWSRHSREITRAMFTICKGRRELKCVGLVGWFFSVFREKKLYIHSEVPVLLQVASYALLYMQN